MATQASDSVKLRTRGSAADELAVIVQRAQAFTNANGAAIAVGEGNTDEIVCRARSGASAPDVGAVLRVEGTFTGVCIQSGKELRCDDAETDTRVDTAAIRALGIRSMVVTPIREDGKIVGVLAVFAPTPHAFTITHVAVLKTMADQISGFLQKERRAREEGHIEPPPPVPMPKPVASVPLPPPVVIKPVGTSSGNGAAAAPARAMISSAPKVEPIRPLPVATDIAPAVPAPKKEEKRTEYKPFDYKPPELKAELAATTAAKASFGTLDAVAAERKSPGPNKLILVGAIVAVLAVGGAIFGFLKMRKPDSATSAQSVQQPAQASASAAQPVTTAAANPAPPVASAPAPAASVSPAETKAEKTERKRAEAENRRSESQRNEEPSKPAAATVTLSNTGSKISGLSSAAPAPVQNVAPSLSVGGGATSDLSVLATPVNSAKPSMVAQSNLVNAKPLHAMAAVYPEIAKTRRISGTIVLKVTVGKDGKAKNPVLLSGPTIFRDAAFDAVKQWVFQPATLNGQAIEQDTQITMKFHP